MFIELLESCVVCAQIRGEDLFVPFDRTLRSGHNKKNSEDARKLVAKCVKNHATKSYYTKENEG